MSESKPETMVAKRRVYSGRVVAVDVDRVRLPDGSVGVREVVRHAGAVVVLPLLDDGRIVLVRQFRYPVGETVLELPAGTLEEGEEPRQCGARELEEETGFSTDSIHELGDFFSTPGFSDELLHSVVATDLLPVRGGARPDRDEHIEQTILTVEEVLERARRGDLRDAKSLATLFLARLGGWI
jgi:ADP-ribose pyrophosphatase